MIVSYCPMPKSFIFDYCQASNMSDISVQGLSFSALTHLASQHEGSAQKEQNRSSAEAHTVDDIVRVLRKQFIIIYLLLLHAFPARSKVRLQTSCSKGCQNPLMDSPLASRQIQARPNQPWARCSVFIPPPASRGHRAQTMPILILQEICKG